MNQLFWFTCLILTQYFARFRRPKFLEFKILECFNESGSKNNGFLLFFMFRLELFLSFFFVFRYFFSLFSLFYFLSFNYFQNHCFQLFHTFDRIVFKTWNLFLKNISKIIPLSRYYQITVFFLSFQKFESYPFLVTLSIFLTIFDSFLKISSNLFRTKFIINSRFVEHFLDKYPKFDS